MRPGPVAPSMGTGPGAPGGERGAMMESDLGLVVRTGRCTECGAKPEAPEAAASAGAAEPITHCEWCGAEYPVPSDR